MGMGMEPDWDSQRQVSGGGGRAGGLICLWGSLSISVCAMLGTFLRCLGLCGPALGCHINPVMDYRGLNASKRCQAHGAGAGLGPPETGKYSGGQGSPECGGGGLTLLHYLLDRGAR